MFCERFIAVSLAVTIFHYHKLPLLGDKVVRLKDTWRQRQLPPFHFRRLELLQHCASNRGAISQVLYLTSLWFYRQLAPQLCGLSVLSKSPFKCNNRKIWVEGRRRRRGAGVFDAKRKADLVILHLRP